jgi:hypothetical protein
MNKSYGEEIATHTNPESCGVACKGKGKSVSKGVGQNIYPRDRQ